MQVEGIQPIGIVFALPCGSIRAINKGEKFHEEISKQGLLKQSVILVNALLGMCVQCDALCWSTKNVVAWTALIAGYAR